MSIKLINSVDNINKYVVTDSICGEKYIITEWVDHKRNIPVASQAKSLYNSKYCIMKTVWGDAQKVHKQIEVSLAKKLMMEEL